jgi:membrane protease YdiL (CAAX protease family)
VGVLGLWLALVLALPASLAAVQYAGISPDLSRGPAWWPLPPYLLLPVLLAAFVLQGGLEELIIRGYIYHTLRDRWRPWISALGSSLLFALLHLGNPDVSASALLNIVLAGMVLAALVERTGSLWSATLAHGAWNFAVACLLSVPVSGVRIFHLLSVTITGEPGLTGDGFGPEGSWLLTAIGVALTVFLWRGLWRRPSDRGAVAARPSAPEDGIPALSS